MIHFEFAEAWAFNPLAFATLPILGYGLGKEFLLHLRKTIQYFKHPDRQS
jgi:hypothetical protein